MDLITLLKGGNINKAIYVIKIFWGAKCLILGG